MPAFATHHPGNVPIRDYLDPQWPPNHLVVAAIDDVVGWVALNPLSGRDCDRGVADNFRLCRRLSARATRRKSIATQQSHGIRRERTLDPADIDILPKAHLGFTAPFGRVQLDALKSAGCSRGWTDKVSGVKTDRPKRAAVMDVLRPWDTLVVWRIDRLGGSLAHIVETGNTLEKRGVAFKLLNGI
ncbi:hypothetical protein JCM9803A_00520 [Rhodococcus erythropolis]